MKKWLKEISSTWFSDLRIQDDLISSTVKI
jgi:hypothetical protein